MFITQHGKTFDFHATNSLIMYATAAGRNFLAAVFIHNTGDGSVCYLSNTAEKYLTDIINSSVGVHCLLDYSNSNIYAVINSLFVAMNSQKVYYELEIYSILFKLFALLYSEGYIIPNSKFQRSHQTEVMVNLIDWIEKNYTEHITLDKLSEISGLSKKYLCRVFKEYTSKTLVNYINELRIENACHEISLRGKNITQAAYDSGFNDLSYFCKTFKKFKNITPNEYKKRLPHHMIR